MTFDNLIYGTYYVKEITAPNGYVKKDDIVKIEINDKGIFINETKIEDENGYYFNFENTKVNTPKTGDTRRTALCGILFTVSSIMRRQLRFQTFLNQEKIGRFFQTVR